MAMFAEMSLEAQGVVSWLAVGLLTGWLAARALKGGGYGLVGDLVVGIIGAVVGGALLTQLAAGTRGPGEGLFAAFIGACTLLACLRVFARESVEACPPHPLPMSVHTPAEGPRTPGDEVRHEEGCGAPPGGRREMEERVARHAAGGPVDISRRLEELGHEPGSRQELDAEERCALKALRGDFAALSPLATAEDRASVSAFEGEGGRATVHEEEDASGGQDRVAVSEALRSARGTS